MSLQRKKKPVEFHFVDMNDPDRYKKLKVARACDFCRRRKSKCDIGIPGSGTCSNCHKHQMVCIFSPVTSRGSDASSTRPEDALLTPQYQPQHLQYQQQQPQQHQQQPNAVEQYALKYPLLCIKDGQVGYEVDQLITFIDEHAVDQPINSLDINNFQEPSLQLESKLFSIYFQQVHPAFPVLLKQSVLNIHSQDRLLLSKTLRYAIMTIACHFYPKTASTPYDYPHNQDVSSNNTAAANYFYDIARKELDTATFTKKLDVVQSLLLLYKHTEIMYKDGTRYLEQAQDLVSQISSIMPQQQEMINRTRWILFGIIGLSNLSDVRYSTMYKRIDLPDELPQALQEEIKDDNSAQQHVNRFAQIANLSVLYSHTVQSLITCSTPHLICLTQFKEIRQHWHDSVTQSRLLTNQDQEQDIDIMILYSAILYDMLYLLLVLHYRLIETEWESIETAYRLQRMVHNLVTRASFLSTVQCRRMASFALMLSLQLQVSRDKIDVDFIQQVRQTLQCMKIDARIDNALQELISNQVNVQAPAPPPPPMDYFSLIPQPIMHSTSSSPLDFPSSSTPGLWDILSTTTNGGLSTPIREEDSNQTSDWILDQQRRQQQQLQMYELQQHMSYFTPVLPGTNNTGSSNQAATTTTAATTATGATTNTDYSYLIPDIWSPTTIENLNQMKI
ncbi:uncharacterized protein ATC70_004302 [Mucor velutinosus]|uniref:Zn(2)-C6 fungal-type domain-containing protein n=1 Tax=Mucor velutinosus TaxID=708070 RepID=A0AAN7I4R9_9FUNG|nr:hypothetical protein ATC70_004302 [Mucor velutinosus]